MNHLPALILATHLIENELGDAHDDTDPTFPIYVNGMPDTQDIPDDCIAIYDTAPKPELPDLDTGDLFERLGVMLRVRDNDTTTAWRKCMAIEQYLATIKDEEVEIDGDTYTIGTVSRTSAVVFVGRDEQRRAAYTTNGTLTVTMAE